MTDCIFCKIINGDIPTNKVYEDEEVLAFLDLSQATKGHTLVIPKKHVTDIFEYDADLASKVFSRIPLIARAIEDAIPGVKGLNILNNNRAIAYQTVFHSHIHLIPRYNEDEGFSISMEDNSKQYDSHSLKQLASTINQAIQEEC